MPLERMSAGLRRDGDGPMHGRVDLAVVRKRASGRERVIERGTRGEISAVGGVVIQGDRVRHAVVVRPRDLAPHLRRDRGGVVRGVFDLYRGRATGHSG